MIGSGKTQPVAARLAQLSHVVQDVSDALHAQHSLLRQRGLGLPPDLLGGLVQVVADLRALSTFLSASAVELEQLRALAHTTSLVNSTLDIHQVLNEVMDTVIALTGAERGYIVLRDEQTSDLEFRVARNLDRETLEQSAFIVSRTVVGQVAETGRPVLATNALADPAFSTQESVVIHALRSILCVPLVLRERVTGVVYVDNRVKDGVFGEKELSLLSAFANQAAIAIENARLFARVQTTLSEVTAMTELMDNVFASIASGVLTTDTETVVTICNHAAERILTVASQGVVGYALAEALPPIYEHLADSLASVIASGAHDWIEIEPVLPQRGEVSLAFKLSPLVNQQTIEGAAIVVDDLTEFKRREATLEAVRRYLPPAMLDNIQSLDGLGLRGERRVITILFVESRPLSSFPEALRAQELMERLNLYLTVGAEAIHTQNGVIDKFMGSEIMGLFNTQLNPAPDHAWQAVLAALKIADDFLALALTLGEEPAPRFRIGVHSGVATVGNVGSPSRRDFTALGDTVNLAKRLEEHAAPGQIIISEDCCRACASQLADPANGLLVIARGSAQMKGRSQATAIYELQRRRA
ncbi:MAG: GAF domain-containing protein [Anaerolineae bacterium]|nr:GAF domain-containing protein [Anaerolineae bacterium]